MARTHFWITMIGAVALTTAIGTGIAFAGSSTTSPTTVTNGKLNTNGTYTYPSTVQVTITNADTSLQPVTPEFDFANSAPTFNPNPSYDGSGTFTLPTGFTAVPATGVTLDLAASDVTKGIYVYNVGVPTSMQTSTYSHLFVFSNYQWSQNGQQVDNYSTLVNLVQQLPELPLAAMIPIVILGGWFLKRRSKGNSKAANA